MDTNTTEKLCPHCHAPVREGDLFCINCGAKLEQEPAKEEEGAAFAAADESPALAASAAPAFAADTPQEETPQPAFDASKVTGAFEADVEEEEEEEDAPSALAEGLPAWTIEPPTSGIRRKGRKS